ncbi:TPA: glycosyltransferase [Klebsiella variicola]|nr:glycosyltransferase [Klebsiella variicola]ELN4237590.1 glycosyltransferase [Klebsiella variicola]ELQ4150872.1 glycosyltransferase [Klebsiella variicola]EMC8478504.1 glycosyltransferase [Klebsiella variicola]MDI0464744.1 glycosyltransferase [Klebsiella variicola]MDO1522070.1 glycosyltransferase [Klebsiella variicola]
MMSDKITIFHEYGEPSHYIGLARLTSNKEIIYREFSTLRLIHKALKKKNCQGLYKAIKDFLYLVLCFLFPVILKNKIIVIGIAPLDYRVIFFNRVLKYTHVIYHTSWTDWSGNFYPKKNKFFKNKIKNAWSFFFNFRVKHIAAVTDIVKDSISSNWGLPREKITTVYHAFDGNVFNLNNAMPIEERNGITFVGRLVKNKGIGNLLEIAKNNPTHTFTIVGEGELADMIVNSKLSNISYAGYISSKNELANIFKKNKYIFLPSIKNENWEELFGMVLPEAMACGCIPVCTDHSGPKIILGNTKLQRLIFKENEFNEAVNSVLKMSNEDSVFLFEEAVKVSQNFEAKIISERWEKILCDINRLPH